MLSVRALHLLRPAEPVRALIVSAFDLAVADVRLLRRLFMPKHTGPVTARPVGFMRVVGAPVSSKSKRPFRNAEQDRRIRALVAREKGKA